MRTLPRVALASPLLWLLLLPGCPADSGITADLGADSGVDSGVGLGMDGGGDLGLGTDMALGIAPAVTGVTPALASTAGGVTLQLDGQNFSPGATVTVAGVQSVAVTVDTPTHLTATLPAKPGAWGKVPVVVRNPDGQSASRSDLFSYYASRLMYPGPSFATGKRPLNVEAADFSGDGKLDLVTVNNEATSISLLIGDGTGSFAAPKDFPAGARPQGLAIGDVNGDKKPDIVVANGPSKDVSVLLGDGMGGFAATRVFASGMDSSSVVIGDLKRVS